MKESLVSVLEEKEGTIRRLRISYESSLSQKESIILSLQSDVTSLSSQLNDRLKQINVTHETSVMKDQHIQLLKQMVSEIIIPLYTIEQ